ncbi:MAG: hydrogenase iron-sulfur subunit [candidate division WOR-3 bacterium]|nr:MAG: hydrogenase iron-sulfur subunit [candidate division WOR-3 bacterium]
MASSTDSPSITVFACTTALHRLPAIGSNQATTIKRLACAGGINAGMLLEAVEDGAGRVLVLACGQDSCRHQNGATLAEAQVRLARDLLTTLGFDPGTVALELVDRAGESVSVACKETAP